MKNYIFIYFMTLFHLVQASELQQNASWTKITDQSEQEISHLKRLYNVYKNLEHVYALNLSYSGTKYECKPEQRCHKIILSRLPEWNTLIRNQLRKKTIFNPKEIELIQTLQIHQKDAQKLTWLCAQYTQWRHYEYAEREAFTQGALRKIKTIMGDEIFEQAWITSKFYEELEEITYRETASSLATIDSNDSNDPETIFDDYPELKKFETIENPKPPIYSFLSGPLGIKI